MSELIHGEALTVLKDRFGEESVQCVVTSPPYWGLRDYGIAPTVWGGHPDCAHVHWGEERSVLTDNTDKKRWNHTENGRGEVQPLAKQLVRKSGTVSHGAFCQDCGAWRGCLGLEPTPDLYVQHMVDVFREIRRVLRKNGTLWLNIGDSYASGKGTCFNPGGGRNSLTGHEAKKSKQAYPLNRGNISTLKMSGLKPKDLVGIPWRLAFALQADGWYLRQDIIWQKPNAMPESVQDRCTKSHEYLFLLSKSARYHFDHHAIKEPCTGNAHARGTGVNPKANSWKGSSFDTGKTAIHQLNRSQIHPKQNASFSAAVTDLVETRSKRSVWTIATKPYREAHFATFPPKLVEPCILAGCPVGGLVLDPFAGSGTVMQVAESLGRSSVGIECKVEYVALAKERCGHE